MYATIVRPWRALPLLLLCWTLAPCPATAASSASPPPGTDLEALREELATLRRDYDARIAALEARLAQAEAVSQQAASQAEQAVVAAQSAPAFAPSPPDAAAGGNANAFNPAIGVIFGGQAWSYEHNPAEYRIPGFPTGGEAGPASEGLALGETELNIGANVDDLFTAWLTIPIVVEDGETSVEVEEAWIETLRLPAGLAARFGRFYSNIGYLNTRHSHTWDFIDQPLAYQAFLGSQYADDGVQLRWLAPTDLYLELGGEVLRGDQYPAAGGANQGVGAQSLFARLGGDVGASNSWQTGLSYLHARSEARQSGQADDPLLFTGDSDLVIAELLWKWSPNGNYRQRYLVFQSEALWRNEDGRYLIATAGDLPIDRDQFGWYAQLVYQPFPQWRVGARFDLLDSDDPGLAFAGTPLDPLGSDPRRYSLMMDWSHSEFSRLRLQYSRDMAGVYDENQWGLQYIFSIGAHGAHAF